MSDAPVNKEPAKDCENPRTTGQGAGALPSSLAKQGAVGDPHYRVPRPWIASGNEGGAIKRPTEDSGNSTMLQRWLQEEIRAQPFNCIRAVEKPEEGATQQNMGESNATTHATPAISSDGKRRGGGS